MTRFLYAATSSLLGLIVLIIGAWAQAMNAHMLLTDARLSLLETHYASIDQKLEDIQAGVISLKSHYYEHTTNNTHKK